MVTALDGFVAATDVLPPVTVDAGVVTGGVPPLVFGGWATLVFMLTDNITDPNEALVDPEVNSFPLL